MSMLSGTYVPTCGAWDNGSVLFPEHPTLPGWMGTHGYATAAVGKMRFRMVRDERWKLVAFPEAPRRLFDLHNDPDERVDWADAPPAHAPMADLEAALLMGHDWATLEHRRQQDRQRAADFRSDDWSPSAMQYRLRDGRIIPGDVQLYPPRDS